MLVRFFSRVVAITGIGLAAVIGLMINDREVPIEVLSTRILTPVVKAGGNFEREVTFIQHRRCRIHSDRALFDAKNRRFLLPPLDLASGNFGEVGKVGDPVVVSIPIPSEAASGPARLETITLYRCNLVHWVWPIVMHTPSPITFEVVPSDQSS